MSETSDGPTPSAAPKVSIMSEYAALKKGKSVPTDGPEAMPSFDIQTITRSAVASEIRGLIAAQPNPLVYSYASQAMEIVEAAIEAFTDEAKTVRAKVARPVPLNPHSVTGPIEAVARWFKINAEGASIPKPLPDWIRPLLIQQGIDEFPTLKAILRHPVVMNGKLVMEDLGYDRDSLFLIKAKAHGKVRPEAYTDTLEQLMDWLIEEWLGEASFDTREDAIRALLVPATMLMTKSHLMAEGKFPGFLISAPDAGTGKSELAHALVEAVLGKEIGDTPWPEKDQNEMQKLITSLVMADVDVILWDNLPNGLVVKNANLDQMMTSLVWTGRVLGQSQMVESPCNALNILTGNNLSPQEDTSDRFVEVRLVLKNGKRKIYNRVSLRQWTQQNRASIIVALGRILTETKCDKDAQVGRFPGWFTRVVQPFMTLTGNKTFLDVWKAPAQSWNKPSLARFLATMRKTSKNLYPTEGGDKPMTAQDLLLTMPDETADFFGVEDAVMDEVNRKLSPSMSDAEREAAQKTQKRALTKAAQSVGMRFTKHADKSADGMRLRIAKLKDHQYRSQPAVWAEMIDPDDTP